MDVLQENFSVLFYLGVWKPLDCAGIKSFIYNLYTLFITSISYTFLLSQILDLIISTRTVSDFTNNIFIVSAILTGCLKIFRFIRSRSTFINIINNFKRGLFKPANDDEIIIWNKYARITRLVTIGATTSLIIGLIVMSYALCSFNIPQRQLLYRAWLPYNYSSLPIIYWLSSMEQLATVHILAGINFSFDLIFFGTMLNICAQINILKLRYKVALSHIYSINDTLNNNDVGELRDVSKLIREYTDSHDSIINSSFIFNNCYDSVLHELSCYLYECVQCNENEFFSFQFFSTALYINNVTIELFILCVCCNEVTLEFADLGNTFYDCQWYAISNSNKKSVAIMMTNTVKPIYFTCGYVIHLSLDSFTSVLKLSYSIYNVLQSAD